MTCGPFGQLVKDEVYGTEYILMILDNCGKYRGDTTICPPLEGEEDFLVVLKKEVQADRYLHQLPQ